MRETFEQRDMADAVFHDVNLHQAMFDNVNLGSATFRNVNLGGVSIEDANIQGLTIFGIRIDTLVQAELDRRDPEQARPRTADRHAPASAQAELDRRDPERARLRMADRHDPASVRAAMTRLDEVRSAFYRLLRSTRPGLLVIRPSPEKWSAIEQVRHMLFAEDLYLNRGILNSDRPWNRMGLLPTFLEEDAAYADVGSQPCKDLETVLAAWDDVHAGTQTFLADVTAEDLQRRVHDAVVGQGTVGQVLQGLANHDLRHIRQAEAVLGGLRE